MLLLFLYGLWIVFNARVTADVLLFGLPVVALIYFFCIRFMGWSVRKDFRLFRKILSFLSFLLCLLWDVIRSAFRVLRLIWSPGKVEPELLHFDPSLHSSAGRVLWADSITLTPGTITVEAAPGKFTVHCLDESTGKGLPDSRVLRRIKKLEGGHFNG